MGDAAAERKSGAKLLTVVGAIALTVVGAIGAIRLTRVGAICLALVGAIHGLQSRQRWRQESGSERRWRQLSYAMEFTHSTELSNRVDDRVGAWRIVVERVTETERSVLAFGRRDNQPVVLKVIKNPREEWRSGEILKAFEGRGVVRVYEYMEGALLLERLNPGQSLVTIALNGADDEATRVLAELIRTMSPASSVEAAPTASDWGRAFERYAASGDTQVPPRLCWQLNGCTQTGSSAWPTRWVSTPACVPGAVRNIKAEAYEPGSSGSTNSV